MRTQWGERVPRPICPSTQFMRTWWGDGVRNPTSRKEVSSLEELCGHGGGSLSTTCRVLAVSLALEHVVIVFEPHDILDAVPCRVVSGFPVSVDIVGVDSEAVVELGQGRIVLLTERFDEATEAMRTVTGRVRDLARRSPSLERFPSSNTVRGRRNPSSSTSTSWGQEPLEVVVCLRNASKKVARCDPSSVREQNSLLRQCRRETPRLTSWVVHWLV